MTLEQFWKIIGNPPKTKSFNAIFEAMEKRLEKYDEANKFKFYQIFDIYETKLWDNENLKNYMGRHSTLKESNIYILSRWILLSGREKYFHINIEPSMMEKYLIVERFLEVTKPPHFTFFLQHYFNDQKNIDLTYLLGARLAIEAVEDYWRIMEASKENDEYFPETRLIRN